MKLTLLRLLIMTLKLSTYGLAFQVLCIGTLYALSGHAQHSKTSEVIIDKAFNILTIEEAFNLIEAHSDFELTYIEHEIDLKERVQLGHVPNKSVYEILMAISRQTGLKFKQINNLISASHISNSAEFIDEISVELMKEIDVSGKITDENGEGLPGASIVQAGTTIGTTSDLDGNYKLTVSEGATLMISFVGYVSREVLVGTQSVIDIQMELDAAQLDEIVIIGYGKQKVTNLTGSVTVIEDAALENRAANNASNLLAGLGSGITVVNTGGQPGNDGSSISIRGNTTFGGSNAPLIVIDGIEASLDNIDPNDIESMSVLKDASASAIYGVRAGNGVIIVKTKRGRKGSASVKFNTSIGFQEFTFMPEFGSSFDYATLLNEASVNDGLAPVFDAGQLEGFQNGTLPNTDWLSAVNSESGATHRYHLSLSGGVEKLSYNASLGYLNSDGIISNTNYRRYNLRVNLDQKIGKKLSIGYSVALSRRDAKEPAGGARGVFFNAYRSLPTKPIQNADGNYVGLIDGTINPVAAAKIAGTRNNVNDEFIGNIKTSYELMKGLTFTNISAITQGYGNVNNWTKTFRLYTEDGDLASTSLNGVATENHRMLDVNIQNFANYEISFGQHNVKALAGHNSIRSDSKGILVSVKELPENNTSDEIALGNPQTLIAGSEVEGNRLESYFGRVNYDWGEKYLVELSFRRDATSRFAPGKRAKFFPSFSLGWNLAKESFFNVESINSIKIRGSWGQLGNQDISNLAFAPIYVTGRDLWLGGITQTTLIEGSSNPDLVWETITKTNFGLDVGLFEHKLKFIADYFIEDRKDILALEQLPGTFGGEAPLANIGNSNAEGIELNLNYFGTVASDLNFNANLNLTYFTKIPTVGGLSGNAEIPGRSNGDPISNLYGFTALGLFQSTAEISEAPDQSFFGGTPVPGDIRYADVNGRDASGNLTGTPDGVVDADDRSSIGTYSPGLFYGLSLNADYKGFDLSLLLQGVGKVQNSLSTIAAHPFVRDGKVQVRHLDRWTPTNPGASYPVLHAVNGGRNENHVNSFFVYNAAYLRLKNIQFGYSLPESTTAKIGLERLRIYFSAENLLTFVNADYPDGFDPEAISTFVFNQEFGGDVETPLTPVNDGTVYPQTKTLTLGLNVVF